MPVSRVSQRQYAARCGVSHVYINRLVREGKLPADGDGRIDPTEADRVLAALRQPAKGSRRKAGAGSRAEPAAPSPPAPEAPMPSPSGSPDLPTLLLKTRIKSEAERAKLLEIKAKVEAGKYVDVDEVKVAAFNKGRVVRDALLNIPDRLAAVLAAEADADKVHALLTAEIRQALIELTGGPGEG